MSLPEKPMLLDFSSLELIPKLLEKITNLENEIAIIKNHVVPEYDLTKREGVKSYLKISDGTIHNMIQDGRFKQNIHYTKQIKGKKIMISFIEDGILAYKKGLK